MAGDVGEGFLRDAEEMGLGLVAVALDAHCLEVDGEAGALRLVVPVQAFGQGETGVFGVQDAAVAVGGGTGRGVEEQGAHQQDVTTPFRKSLLDSNGQTRQVRRGERDPTWESEAIPDG